MSLFNKRPKQYQVQEYKKDKEEIIQELASWCYLYDTTNISDSRSEEDLFNAANTALIKLMLKRIEFLKSDFYPGKIDGKKYVKSNDGRRALHNIKESIEEIIGYCSFASRLTINRVNARLWKLEISKA